MTRLAGILLALIVAATAVDRRAQLPCEPETTEAPDSLKAEAGADDSDDDTAGDQLSDQVEEQPAIERLRADWAFHPGNSRAHTVEIRFPPWA